MNFQLFSKVLQKSNRINFRSAASTAKWNVCCELVSLLTCPVSCVQVLITIYWLGRKAQLDAFYKGPQLNFKAFEGLLGLALSKVRGRPLFSTWIYWFFYREVTLPFLNAGPRWGHKCLRERRLVPGEGGLCALQAQQSDGKLCRPPNSSSKQRRCVFLLCGANSRTAFLITTAANFLQVSICAPCF